MPIDPNIILGVKPAQFQQTDPLESYGKSLALKGLIGQQELHGLQTQQARQGIDDENAVRSAYQQSGGDPATLRALLMKGGQHKAIDAFDKRQLDNDKAKTDIAKNKMELAVKATAQHRDALANVNDPQAAAAWVQAGYQDPALREIFSKAGPVEAALQGIPQDPEGFQKWKQQNALGATKFIELNKPNIHMQDTGGASNVLSMPGLGGPTTVVSATPKTQSPDSVASNATSQRGQNMLDARAQQTLAQPKMHYDSDRGIMVNERTGGTTPAVDAGGQPVGQKPNKPTEAYLKNQTGVANVRNAIGEYKTALDSFKIADLANPDARARMGTSYNNMMLQAKEAYNLGVLNGPDYMILQQVVTNPLTLKGGITSNAAMKDQAEHLDKIMAKISETSAAVHGQPVPKTAPTGAADAPITQADIDAELRRRKLRK